jgi:hypothetical protein
MVVGDARGPRTDDDLAHGRYASSRSAPRTFGQAVPRTALRTP